MFASRGFEARDLVRIFSAIRHGLPADGELHLIEHHAAPYPDDTVAGLLGKAGFKVVERTASVRTFVGAVETYRALKQPPAAHPQPRRPFSR